MEIKALSTQTMVAYKPSANHHKNLFEHHLRHHYDDDKQSDVRFNLSQINETKIKVAELKKPDVHNSQHINNITINQINNHGLSKVQEAISAELVDNHMEIKDTITAAPKVKQDLIAHTLNNAISTYKKDTNSHQNVKLIDYLLVLKNQKPSHVHQQGDALNVSLRMSDSTAIKRKELMLAIKDALKVQGLYLSSLKINGVLQ